VGVGGRLISVSVVTGTELFDDDGGRGTVLVGGVLATGVEMDDDDEVEVVCDPVDEALVFVLVEVTDGVEEVLVLADAVTVTVTVEDRDVVDGPELVELTEVEVGVSIPPTEVTEEVLTTGKWARRIIFNADCL